MRANAEKLLSKLEAEHPDGGEAITFRMVIVPNLNDSWDSLSEVCD